MAIEGGIIEQKTIGINMQLTGTNINTELVNGNLQLKKINSESEVYYSSGQWLSEIINIGDKFKEYGKLIMTTIIEKGASITVLTRSSDDGVSFNQWVSISNNGDILSEKKQYLQVRIDFVAGVTKETTLIDNSKYQNEYLNTIAPTNAMPLVPTLTSNTSNSTGFPFSETQFSDNYTSFHAFDNNIATYYSSESGKTYGKLGYYFNEKQFVSKYRITCMNSNTTRTYMPTTWTVEASNDTTNGLDGTWEVLETVTNETWLVNSQIKDFSINTNKSYNAYRLNWTKNNGNASYSGLAELNFYDKSTGVISVKDSFDYEMSQITNWEEEGILYTVPIDMSKFKEINTLQIIK